MAVKIEHAVYQSSKMFGRHFDDKDEVLSHVSRTSIDVLKVSLSALAFLSSFMQVYAQSSFKADVTMEEWVLIKNLKPVRIRNVLRQFGSILIVSHMQLLNIQ